MKKFLLIFYVFFLAQFTLDAKSYYTFTNEQARVNHCVPFVHNLLSDLVFEGDKEGQFVGDVVAVLDDDSRWKVHPDHAEIFGQWQPGEEVHVDVEPPGIISNESTNLL